MQNYTLTKKEAATILAKAWNNLDATLIEPYIAEDIIYWSQQVLIDMTGKKAVMEYLKDKMESIRKSPDCRYLPSWEKQNLPQWHPIRLNPASSCHRVIKTMSARWCCFELNPIKLTVSAFVPMRRILQPPDARENIRSERVPRSKAYRFKG